MANTTPAPLPTYTQILAWIARLNLIRDLLAAANVAIPGVISDALTMANNLAAAFKNAQPPTNAEALIADFLTVLQAVETVTQHNAINVGVVDIIAGITWAQSTIFDVVSGQFGTVATSQVTHEGETFDVALVALRMDKGHAAYVCGFTETEIAVPTQDAVIPATPEPPVTVSTEQVAAATQTLAAETPAPEEAPAATVAAAATQQVQAAVEGESA